MKKSLLSISLGISFLSLSLTGCGTDPHPSYSSFVEYEVRTDPIVTTDKLGDERFDPDRPGILPLLNIKDIQNPDHPMYPKRDEIKTKELLRDPNMILPAVRQELGAALKAVFGTPAAPKVDVNAMLKDSQGQTDPTQLESAQEAISKLKLDDKTLATGSKNYRIHCVHCHGVPGDGRGHTAKWINPHPRDFRSGKFKFQSINRLIGGVERPPSRADLLRTLRHGIEGTAMPTFNLLKDDELESLVSYVIHLSIRGKVELDIITFSFKLEGTTLKGPVDDEGNKVAPLEAVKSYARGILYNADNSEVKKRRDWLLSQDDTLKIPVAPYKQEDLWKSIERGQMLFTAKPSEAFRSEYLDESNPRFHEVYDSLHKERFDLLYRRAKREAKEKEPPVKEEELKQQVEAALKKETRDNLEGTLKLGCVSCHVDYGRQAK